MPSPTEITVAQLSRLVGTPQCPRLIDVRVDEDFAADPVLIPGAKRRNWCSVDTWAEPYRGQHVAVMCQRGAKLSQGVAALLRTRGIHAETLEGGHVAWRKAGLPAVPEAKLPARDGLGRTFWVTRERPKIDRIACPWLIRRFIDPDAVFLYVAASQVNDVASRFGAAPFDVENVFWSHRGDTCTFDTMVAELGLSSPALDRLAAIVRGADTARLDIAPQAAGLLAASLGFSRMHRDDLEQLEAAMPLYDAFYRWCRDATEETHNWPATKPAA